MRKINKIEPRVPTITKLKKVAAYARVSVEKGRTLNSLSAQVSYYNNLIQRNNEWEYVGVYADSGISGTKTEGRDEFNRLLADCENGLVDIILCKIISRFARNTVDLLATVRHLKTLGIEVRFEKENINSLSSDGELMLSILASFAQEESISISNNVKWAIRKGFQKGKPRIGIIYGYEVKNGKLKVNEHQKEVVIRIFNLYLNGNSAYAISKILNNDNIPTYYNKKWHSHVVLSILRNEKYVGNCLLQKYYTQNPLTHQLKPNSGELPMYYATDTHSAIINEELFNKVQIELSRRGGTDIVNTIATKDKALNPNDRKSNPNRTKANWDEEMRAKHAEVYKSRETMKHFKYDLSLFIKCEECGQNLTAQRRIYADKSIGVKWVCYKHYKLAKSDTKPPFFDDEILKNLICDVLNIEVFDSDIMIENLTHISVEKDMLTFHFINGDKTQKQYPKVKQKYRRSIQNG